MYEVILTNGDRAEADTLTGALLAAKTLRDEAVRESGCDPNMARKTIITRDGQYDPIATKLAQNGEVR